MEPIFFLVYLNRSGSSYLFEQLSRYPSICVCLEAEVLIYGLLLSPFEQFTTRSYHSVMEWCESDPKLKHWDLNKEDLQGLKKAENNLDAFRLILESYQRKFFPNTKIIAFKGTKLIDVFQRFPNLLIDFNIQGLGLVRDPRGVFNSQRVSKDSIGGVPFAKNAISFSLKWNLFVKKLLWLERKAGLKIFKYEEMIEGSGIPFESIPSDSIGEIGIPCEGNYFKRLPEVQAGLHPFIVNEPQICRIGAWAKELNPAGIKSIGTLTRKGRQHFSYPKFVVPWQPGVFFGQMGQLMGYVLESGQRVFRWLVKRKPW